MRDGTERKSSSSSSPSPAPDCDVGLGLRMQLQPSDSYSCGGSGGGGGGGGTFFCSTSNPLAYMGEISEAADRVVLPRGFHTTLTASGVGAIPVSGKALFTYSQWQELERQKMIQKYIMASIPVPPQLLLPTPSPSLSQSNTSGQDIPRFPTNGSDPEPWRCKRTDGKKWRCSRDVAPDQKYCERHAHKSRPRSRKHVEISSHNSYSQQSHQPLQRSTASHFPTMASSTPSSYDQTRCIEWFMRGGSSSSSSCNKQQQQQQWQQLMHKDDRTTDQDKNLSLLHEQNYEENKKEQAAAGFVSSTTNNPYINQNRNHHPQLSNNSTINSTILDKRTQTTTRHFIDAWEKEGLFEKGLSPSPSPSSSLIMSSKKLSPYSLSLSMSGDNDSMNDRNENCPKPQWMMNPVSNWMNDASSMAAPGGPLGEALCLGGGNTAASPHNGYYYSNNSNTNSSSCSKSSCDDAPNFIG